MNFWRSLALALMIVALGGLLALSLLVWRGFRATSTPSMLEAAAARRLRNLAIPRSERERKNPVARDDQALREGREHFLTQCAVCHGIDGSGKTQVGLNLYPRVPDLRSSYSQNLTDGEIHYIIENGVQLTGMPAWAKAHHSGGDESWPLVTYIRSLRPLTQRQIMTQAKVASEAHYVGSEACRRCHQQLYDRWKKTPMANVVRDPRTHPDAMLGDLAKNSVSKFSMSQVAFVYGSIWKQRYFTKIGDDYFPLPVQWNVVGRQWLAYHVPSTGGDWWAAYYPSDNMQRPTGPLCDGCHSVGYDIHTRQVAEWNVGCERCHGPGSAHATAPTSANIFNPGRRDTVANTDVCIQCHSQGQPLHNPIDGKYYDWPVGYTVGQPLHTFWKLENCSLGQTDFYYFADCTAHKNRMQGNDFVQSVMYRRGVSCASCHDVHGTGNYAQLRKPPEQLCLDCHGPSSPNGPHTSTLEAHTHHNAGSPGGSCVACHMPAIQSEGVPGALVHAHTFRFISPAMTRKYSIPNPCTSCHKDKSLDWAEDSMRAWPDYSSWRGAL
jgi:predicted CXXCH cytochrome family protein